MKVKAMRAAKKVFKKPGSLKMSKRSEKALDMSIEHWYRVKSDNENVGQASCRLCKVYQKLTDEVAIVCAGCPVYKKTGMICCGSTPYSEYAVYRGKSEPKRKRLAQAEIEFLESCYY